MFDLITAAVAEDKIENGAYLHLIHPVEGEPMYRPLPPLPDGKPDKSKPMRALVRSKDSKAARDHTFKVSARSRIMGRKSRPETQEKIVDQLVRAQTGNELASVLIGLENCKSDADGLVNLSEDECQAIADDGASQWLVRQVVAFSEDIANFGGKTPEGE